ncbi:MAG: alcohol dehydrogenase [Meiothermus sp.]
MRAAVITGPGRLETQDLPIPEAGPGQVRVKVASTGVCGTDLHLLGGHFHAVFPLVPGHEISGTIDQIGQGVNDLKEGDAVALDPVVSCGSCHYCHKGLRQHCEHFQALGVTRAGGFAEYVVAPAANAYTVGKMPLQVAAFAEPLGCVAWGIQRLKPEPATKALLFGVGPIGLLLMQALLASGASSVTVVDPIEDRLELAKTLGASRTLKTGPEVMTQLKDLEPYGFDIVTEATGRPEVVQEMPNLATKGGKILIFGVSPDDATVQMSPYQIFQNDLTVLGSFSLMGTVPMALEWLASGRVNVEPLITHRLPIERLNQALDYKNHPGMAGAQKVLIEPGAT